MASCPHCNADLGAAADSFSVCPACRRQLRDTAETVDFGAAQARSGDVEEASSRLPASTPQDAASTADTSRRIARPGNADTPPSLPEVGRVHDRLAGLKAILATVVHRSGGPSHPPGGQARLEDLPAENILHTLQFRPGQPMPAPDLAAPDELENAHAEADVSGPARPPVDMPPAIPSEPGGLPAAADVDGGAPDRPEIRPPGGNLIDTDRTAATIDSANLPAPMDTDRMTAMWGGASAMQSNPRMTIKTSDTVTSSATGSHLIIKKRALSQSHEPDAPTADYELLNVIGTGGMGVVYAARQASIDRTVAVKMLKGEYADRIEQRDKFLSEAVVTGDLDHPNIVPIYDLGTNEGGALFYAMKRVRGTPWMDVIGSKSLPENIEILMKVADAVAFAHARGVVHRDLKPENVMLGDYGEVLVMDWGLAIATEAFRNAGSITQSGSMGGTPAYMAPEMATGPIERVNLSSDIYLLGALLYEIITGQPPHTGKTIMACVFAAAKNEIQPTEKSGELLEIAMRAMATSPRRRYRSVQEFQAAVRLYQSHSESLALSSRAGHDLEAARRGGDYQDFARAMFALQEAIALWDGNQRAREMLVVTQIEYAENAREKGDIDLGLSLVSSSQPKHAAVRTRLLAAQRERDARQQRLANLRRTAAVLAIVLFVFVTGAFFVITGAWRESEANFTIAEEERIKANDAAILARARGKEAYDAAEEAAAQAEKARIARNDATKKEKAARKAELAARKNETEAKAARRQAEDAAYIAQIGFAQSMIDGNAFQEARRLLGRYLSPELSHLRHWEWGRLWYLCNQGSVELPIGAPVDALAYRPDGLQIAVGSLGGEVRIYPAADAVPAKPLLTIRHGREVYAVAYSPDGAYLATASDEKTVNIWDAASGELTTTFAAHDDSVLSLEFSTDGRWLLTSSYDKSARLWDVADVKNPQRAHAPLLGHSGWVWQARLAPGFSPDSPDKHRRRIVTAGQDGKAIVWQARTTMRRLTIAPETEFHEHASPVYAAAISPDARWIATGGHDLRIRLWNPDDVRPPDIQRRIADEPDPPAPHVVLEGHGAPVRCLDFSFPDGDANAPADNAQPGRAARRFLLSGSDDNTARLWQLDESAIAPASGAGSSSGVRQGDAAIQTLRGHGGWVRACAFSPVAPVDDMKVLTGSHDRMAKIWSVAAYEEVRVLQARLLDRHDDAVLAVGFSPDGESIVTASRDRTARRWNILGLPQKKPLEEGHDFLATHAIFFSGAKRMLTSAADDTVRIWDFPHGTELRRLTPTGRTAAVALSPDEKWVLTGGERESPRSGEQNPPRWNARVWDVETGRVVYVLAGHVDEVTAVAFSPDGRWMLTGDNAGRCRLWDTAAGKEVWPQAVHYHSEMVVAAAFLPDGRGILTASGDKTVSRLDIQTGREIRRFAPLHPKWVTAMAVSGDGRRAVTSCEDGRVRLWDVETGTLLGDSVVAAGGHSVQSVAFSSDGSRVLTASSQARLVEIWRITGEGFTVGETPQSISAGRRLLWSATFTPDGKNVLMVGGNDARLWNLEKNRELVSFGPHAAVASANFSPGDGRYIITGSWDGSAKIWDVETGRAKWKLEGHHDGPVNTALFLPDGKSVLTAGDDGTARLWNFDAARDAWIAGKVFRARRGPARAAVATADGRRLLIAYDNGSAVIWDVDRPEPALELRHAGPVLCGAFSPDGMLAITGSDDRTAAVWDTTTGVRRFVLSGHTAPVTSVAFSRDDDGIARRALTGSEDSTAKLWDIRIAAKTDGATEPDGRPAKVQDNDAPAVAEAKEATAILTLKGHAREVTSVAFSPQGRYILTGSRDGTAVIWLADNWQQPALARHPESKTSNR